MFPRSCKAALVNSMFKIARLWLTSITTSVLLAGCSILPTFGPSDDAILENAQNQRIEEAAPPLAYGLVDISPQNLSRYASRHRQAFQGSFTASGPVATARGLATGDVLQVIVWEPTNNGLFSTATKRAEELTVVVDPAGNISLPYVGDIPVRERSVAQVRAHLVMLYSRQAVNPEVQVRVVKSDANSISILGDVANAGQLELPLRGARLLDLIARAGGIAAPAWEVIVSVTRKGHTQTVRYDDILAHARNNVIVRPNDTIQITHQPRLFSVFGAVNKPGRFGIDKPVASVLDVLGAAGGLDENQAEPQSIFVYRPAAVSNTGEPMIYRFDLRRSDAFFLGSAFVLEDDDVTYVATAESSDLRKFLSIVFAPLRSAVN